VKAKIRFFAGADLRALVEAPPLLSKRTTPGTAFQNSNEICRRNLYLSASRSRVQFRLIWLKRFPSMTHYIASRTNKVRGQKNKRSNEMNTNAEAMKTPIFEAVSKVVAVRMPCRSCGLMGADSALRG
jgi:hypothetical protein